MIVKNQLQIQNTLQKQNSAEITSAKKTDAAQQKKIAHVKYSNISFGAIYNVKSKKINIENERLKLLKQMNEFLETENEDLDLDDMIANSVRNALSYIRITLQKEAKIVKELEELANDKKLNQQQKINRAFELQKAYKQLQSGKIFKKKPKSPSKQQDEKTDYLLINKFKSAISEENYNLSKVFSEYYEELNRISTVKELNEKYPKIKTPSHPEEVIAKKIANSFTRDFYEDFDELLENKERDELFKLVNNKVKEIVIETAAQKDINANKLYEQIASPTHKAIIEKYGKIKFENGFSSIPVQRKNQKLLLSDNDIKLLSVDFDKFVLDVVKKQYLESQKLNDIKYTEGNITISAGMLKEPEYKFEKVSEKTKKLISSAQLIHTAQRDYENADVNELKKRLNFHANSDTGSNEAILETIINFDICSFTDEDKQNLIKFLRVLDKILDEKLSIDSGVEIIQKEKLHPSGTEKLNERQQVEAAEKIKIEQKQAFELKNIKNQFDDAINILYMNNLNNLAATCSKYRPENNDEEVLTNAKFITETIIGNIKSQENKTINNNKIESVLMRWDTFNFYKNNDAANPIYLKAIKSARHENGDIDIDKAGKYLINSEIVENYPKSLEFVRTPDILSKIMDKTYGDKESAVKYLCKFDEYQDLEAEEKTHIQNFINIFDLKDSVEKSILKFILENDYSRKDTTVLTNLYENGNETINATISARAKQQIMDKYKYPLCIEFLTGFENALTSFAKEKGSSGIKKTTRNNKAIEYKLELKLMGHDDRLFSVDNNYYFDIFSERGLH